MAFFVAEFVLVMQFLWKYIDEIIGKGFSFSVLIELIFYFAVRIIPEAVPVTILISSVMVFGNLAEKYELSSMKSAGISLLRIMMAGVMIAFLTGLFSLFASNYLKPRANYKFLYRFNSIQRQKPALSIQEGVFNTDFKNFTIRVGEKAKDGQNIKDVLVYDSSSPDRMKLNMLTANSGKMYSKDEGNYFIMELQDGEQYRELDKNAKDKKVGAKMPNPLLRTKFKTWSKVFDLSEFDMEAKNLDLTRKEYDLLNSFQLMSAIDSLNMKLDKNKSFGHYNFENLLEIENADPKETKTQTKKKLPKKVRAAISKQEKQDLQKSQKTKSRGNIKSKQQKDSLSLSEVNSILWTFKTNEIKKIVNLAKQKSSSKNDRLNTADRTNNSLKKSRSMYLLRLNQQYSWALICIVFLFIGAPLGSIVKKGGYGYPLLIAIVFFMLFIILNIMGDKLNRTGTVDPVLAAWLPNLVLIPIAVFISFKALNDSDFTSFSTLIGKIKNKLASSKAE